MGSNVSHCEEEEAPVVEEVAEEPSPIEAEPEAVIEELTKSTMVEVKTPPPDMRFPTTNQARHCYTRYNEYHKCVKEKGEGADECAFYQKAYWSLCPNEWVTKWNEERENGTFPGKY
mmetsp:Transcript_2622/g.4383  ORF Transcript_2622/g.4383 Transcript_2622/m.4383 type:complete len:117 (-) Transcript_2622:137-487(-)|eukprot:CAMPEP_0177785402 /NCGR_PEP_ID=MMETSP0491_2-20121128/20297_1 /TAXON_ID=63592 /ORGANISM="Tetraselmis chuii, Strain PLY429" /LENGTH=116 /DNA_ID=CAMNT_0019306397 /DNA_START=195 /DNA_END=545 /DNA_ORIENTATION=+